MDGYFIGMHRYLRIRKSLLDIVSSAELNTMALKSKCFKIVSYNQDNKAWDIIYVLLKILSLVFGFFVLQIETDQEYTSYSTIPQWQIYPYSNQHLILITKNYSRYKAHHLLRYGFHQIATMKRKGILILIIQILLNKIFWKNSVPQYVNYGRKDNYTSTLILQ